MRRTWPPLTAAIALSFVGVYLSGVLLGKHMHVPGAPAFLNSLCESESGNLSCDAVLNSRWGVFPPKPEEGQESIDKDAPEPVRIPVAYLGMAYYTVLLVWYVAVGRPSHRGRMWQLGLLGFNASGLAFSAWFVSVMFWELETWCLLCVGTHSINLLLLVVNVLLWPRKPLASPAVSPDTKEAAPLAAEVLDRAHPTMRLAVVAGLLAAALIRLEYGEALNSRLVQNNNQVIAALQEFQKVGAGLVAQFTQGRTVGIRLRSDDPIRYNDAEASTLVVWSDFECSHCRKFGEKFEREIRGQLDNQVRMVFRHYPLSNECNPYVTRAKHPNACTAARLAEAVRMQGGTDKFWEVHDLLFAGQKQLKSFDPAKVAKLLELNVDQLIADMDSEAVKKRIAADIEQGHKAGLRATPAIYMDGRAVTSLARDVPGFWRELGRRYRKLRDTFKDGPPAPPAEAAATPGSPSQRGAR